MPRHEKFYVVIGRSHYMTTGGTCQSYEYERNAAWHLRATNSKKTHLSNFPRVAG